MEKKAKKKEEDRAKKRVKGMVAVHPSTSQAPEDNSDDDTVDGEYLKRARVLYFLIQHPYI